MSYLVKHENKIDLIINDWESLLFLEGVMNKRNVALALEYTQAFLTDETDKDYEDTVIFAVIRNIFSKIESNISLSDIMTNTIQIVKMFSGLHNDYIKNNCVDISKYNEDLVERDLAFIKNFANNYNIQLTNKLKEMKTIKNLSNGVVTTFDLNKIIKQVKTYVITNNQTSIAKMLYEVEEDVIDFDYDEILNFNKLNKQ